jgi:thiol-disulfide isomerase/thioredoxin
MKKALLSISMFTLVGWSAQAQTPLTTAVDFNVTTLQGDDVNLFSLLNAGKHVVVDFFWYNCGTCAQLAPQFEASYQQFGCNTGDVFYISIEALGTDAQTHAFEQNAGLAGIVPTVSGLGGGGSAVKNTYGISAYPTFILIAPNRQILNQDIWPFSQSILASELNAVGISPKACNVGIDDVNREAAHVVAFPNPATDKVSFRFELTGADRMTMEVYDIMGQRVSVQTNDGLAAGTNTIELPVDALAKGHYTARFSAANGFVGQTRFSVMR